jgi:hypothetical protein
MVSTAIQKEVPEQMQALDRAIAEMNTLICDLGSVVSPYTGEDSSNPVQALCPLADNLREMVGRINQANAILRRVQL